MLPSNDAAFVDKYSKDSVGQEGEACLTIEWTGYISILIPQNRPGLYLFHEDGLWCRVALPKGDKDIPISL